MRWVAVHPQNDKKPVPTTRGPRSALRSPGRRRRPRPSRRTMSAPAVRGRTRGSAATRAAARATSGGGMVWRRRTRRSRRCSGRRAARARACGCSLDRQHVVVNAMRDEDRGRPTCTAGAASPRREGDHVREEIAVADPERQRIRALLQSWSPGRRHSGPDTFLNRSQRPRTSENPFAIGARSQPSDALRPGGHIHVQLAALR
jgi:hypothetical protein